MLIPVKFYPWVEEERGQLSAQRRAENRTLAWDVDVPGLAASSVYAG